MNTAEIELIKQVIDVLDRTGYHAEAEVLRGALAQEFANIAHWLREQNRRLL
jgi:hypothetical protein